MNPWEIFFINKVREIFNQHKSVVDIGGGLRFLRDRGSRFDPEREWIAPLAQGVDYKILDPVGTYNPHIVGDIHKLPFANESQEAIVCLSVLEHVEDPFLATRELYRVMAPGGKLLVHVPFLLYYHAEKGYYKDYWRFSEDAILLMFRAWKTLELIPIRGSFAAWIHLSPFKRIPGSAMAANLVDKLFGKFPSRQTSGYYVFLEK